MTLHQTLAKNTVQQLVGKAISTALGMLAVAIMARYLGVEKFGWYVTAAGFLQFVALICDFGFTVTISNLLAEPGFNKQDILQTTFSWRFVSALIFHILGPIIFLFFPYPPEIKLAVFITAVSFFAQTISQVFIGYYREALNIKIPVIAEILGRLTLVGGVSLIAFYHYSFLPVMAVISLASIISTTYLWYFCRPITFNFNPEISRVLWRKLAPTALTVLFNAIYLQGDRVILPLFVSQTDVGYYGASYRVLDIVMQTAALIMGLIMPLITFAWSRGLVTEFKERLNLGFTTLALIMVPMSAGIIVLSTPIITFVAGAKFVPAGSMLAMLTISMFGVVLGMAFGHVVLAINRQREAVWIYGSCALLSLAGYLVLIPRYGVTGAIGVTIFSEWYTGLSLMLMAWYYGRALPILLPQIKIILATLIMSFVVFRLSSAPLYLSIATGIGVYGCAILFLKIIKIQQIKEFFTN